MGITEWLIRSRSQLFAGSDSAIASLILWHMVEETEHKNVAWDLYNHLYGDWRGRAWGLVCGTVHVALSSRKGYAAMLKRDGLWRSPLSRFRLWADGGALPRPFLARDAAVAVARVPPFKGARSGVGSALGQRLCRACRWQHPVARHRRSGDTRAFCVRLDSALALS